MNDAFYNSKSWKDCRSAYIKTTHGLCERCLKQGIHRPGVIVHHKIPINARNINDPNITLNFDNLELLCWECHSMVHHGTEIKESRVMFDDEGNCIEAPRF